MSSTHLVDEDPALLSPSRSRRRIPESLPRRYPTTEYQYYFGLPPRRQIFARDFAGCPQRFSPKPRHERRRRAHSSRGPLVGPSHGKARSAKPAADQAPAEWDRGGQVAVYAALERHTRSEATPNEVHTTQFGYSRHIARKYS
ncbi:hypothetical protein PsYK624_045500 [Phanerochaete sordida]|uniref:Uncharacterized protein n=1 Tax=Phanerochaete sordida TaxID=48140 RepID=A0A9P3LC35_9APHY|nr:hypothetical protein PsYK624_045500 [Phanerochaete sordida]